MPVYCDMKGCASNSKSNTTLSFFELPKNPRLRQRWLEFIEVRNDKRSRYRICINHFEGKHIWKKYPRPLLTPHAIPTLNGPLNNPTRLQNEDNIHVNTEQSSPQTTVRSDPAHRISDHSEEPNSSTGRWHKEQETDVCGTPVKKSGSAFKVGVRRQNWLSQRSPKTLRLLLQLRKTVRKLQSKYHRVRTRQVKSQCKLTLDALLETSAADLPKETQILLRTQLHLKNINKYRRRYSDSLKDIALSIFYHSPKTYRFLRSFLTLPTTRTLRTYQNSFPIKVGINEQILDNLKDTFANQKKENKVVSLLFDEINLKQEIHFSPQHDQFIGLADNGVVRQNKLAKSALVCMVTWINMKAKQVVGYWFLPSANCSESTHDIIQTSVDKLFKSGLIVKSIICDQGPRNIGLKKKLNITVEKPYFERHGHKIFLIFDPPHLLKSLRNNLRTRALVYSGGVVDWKDIELLFQLSKDHSINLIPKISKNHFNLTHFNKMRVSLAAQIFSYTVHIALVCFKRMFPENFNPANTQTETFIHDIDRLFDTFNSSLKKPTIPNKLNYAISDDSNHINFLIEMEKKFKSLKFCHGTRPPCIDGWRLTINSMVLLQKDLKCNYNICQIFTRRLNQDPLENLFSVIRQQHGCSTDPSPIQFQMGLRHILITQLSKLSQRSNCESDNNFILTKLSEIRKIRVPTKSVCQTIHIPVSGSTVQAEYSEIEEFGVSNAMYYISGYLCKKFLTHHNCSKCSEALLCNNGNDHFQSHKTFTYLKTYENTSGLTNVKESAYQTISKWEEKYNATIDTLINATRISHVLCEIFENTCPMIKLCCPEATKQFLSTWVRIRCHWHARYLRRNAGVAVKTNKKFKRFVS